MATERLPKRLPLAVVAAVLQAVAEIESWDGPRAAIDPMGDGGWMTTTAGASVPIDQDAGTCKMSGTNRCWSGKSPARTAVPVTGQREADREFTKAFTPNKYGEYA